MFINKVSIYQKHVHEMLRGIPLSVISKVCKIRFYMSSGACLAQAAWNASECPQFTSSPNDLLGVLRPQTKWFTAFLVGFKKLTQIQAEDCEQIERPRISDICVKLKKNIYIYNIYYIDIPFVPPIMSLLTTAFVTSVHGVAKIVLICAAGAYLEKAGILHKESWCCEESDSTKKTV